MYLFPHNPIFFLILNFALHYERLVSSNNYYLNFRDEKKSTSIKNYRFRFCLHYTVLSSTYFEWIIIIVLFQFEELNK